MKKEEAQEYAKTMSYKEAVLNCIHSKGIAYRKASLIKLRELAEIADKLERDNDMTKEETIKWLKSLKVEIGKSEHGALWHYAEAIDAAIEALSADKREEEYADEIARRIATIIENEQDMRVILESAEAVQGWIPCSERLPKENEYVDNICKYYLTQDEYGDMHVAHLNSRGWETIESVKALGCDVVAWMPLPTPYKGGDTECN